MTTKEKNFSAALAGLIEIKGFNPEKLADVSGVPPHFIERLINENFDKLPPAPYVRGYILKIADALNTDGNALWQDFQKENELIKKSGAYDHLPHNRFAPKKISRKKIILCGILIAAFAYLAFRSDNLLGRPNLYLATPAIDEITSEPIIKITGQINPKDAVKINSQEVFADQNGNFEKDLNLQIGLNNIEIKVKRFLGREIIENRRVIYAPLNQNNNIQQNDQR
ncbi:MAG: helix-turn-helix domain-containing protein [Candidatus Brennerbacteria bacterium]|nr:helix-turn-helix domain-containing protein [Candidatus Brennerbacteria bacterium]